MKKKIAFLLTLCTLFLFYGCSSNERLADPYFKTIESGNYTLDCIFTQSAEGLTLDMDCNIIVSGNKQYICISLLGATTEVLILDGTTYLLDAANKIAYKTVPDSTVSMDSFQVETDVEFVSSQSVEKNGVSYTCEEYKNADGSSELYYFQGKELAMIESVISGETVVFTINNLTNEIDASKLSIPKGYTVELLDE